MRERSWFGGFFGFLAGLGIGAAVGLLFAPASGRDTRDNLRDAAEDIGGRLRSEGRKFARSARDTVDQAREQVRDAVSAGKQAYEEKWRGSERGSESEGIHS